MRHPPTEAHHPNPYENGITEEHLEGAIGTPGPLGWLLDVVDDWEAFAAAARAEDLAPQDLVRKAVSRYIHAA